MNGSLTDLTSRRLRHEPRALDRREVVQDAFDANVGAAATRDTVDLALITGNAPKSQPKMLGPLLLDVD